MVQYLLKSLFLFAVSAVLAAPAHQVRTAPLARGVAPRKDLHSPHPLAAGLKAPMPAAFDERSQEKGGGLKITNAIRLANGLPPLAPRRLYDGSRSRSAHKARSSPALPVSIPAVLVYGADGRSSNLLGYLAKDLSEGGSYQFKNDCKKAMVNSQLVSGALMNPAQPNGYSNVGLLAMSLGNPVLGLGTSAEDYAMIVGTASTPKGEAAVSSKDHSWINKTSYYIESNVWSLGGDKELIPTWINPNGDVVTLEMAHNPGQSYVFTTGSISALSKAFIDSYDEFPTDPGFIKLRFFVADTFSCPPA